MAKKTKSSKKHRFKHAQPTTSGAGIAESTMSVQAASASQPATAPTSSPSQPAQAARFVAADLRRLALLLASLTVLELVLWYLMEHTGLGPAVYNLIHV